MKKILLCFLALGLLLVSCGPEEEGLKPSGPAKVEKLVSPKEGLSVNMYFLEVLRFEWKSAGEGVRYELVFDKADGDFSEPVASFETDETSMMFSREDIQKIFEDNADEKGEVAELSWGVYTVSKDGRILSSGTRHITFTTVSAPAVVETLVAPGNDVLFNLAELDGDVTFSWSKANWIGDAAEISYTLVIDEAEKDFSAPLYRADSDNTSVSVAKDILAGLYAASSAAADGEAYSLKWTVYARIGTVNTAAEEVRTFSIIPELKEKPFEAGDPLYIGVPSSSEDGQIMTFVDADYYRTDNDSWHDRMEKIGQKWNFPYYEVFVSLRAGQKYCFYALGNEGAKAHFFKADALSGFAEKETEDAALTGVQGDGIYRIRIDVSSSKVDIRKVEYINLRFAWGGYDSNSYTDASMTYSGKGLWTIPSYHIVLKDQGSYKEDRYRFVMKLEGIEQVQGLSKNNEGLVTNEKPGQGEDPSYWHLQLSYTGWDHWVFKYPSWLCDDSNLGRWTADVNIYMNADKGHYTHEFVNPVEVKAFEDGDPLFIEGEGTESGQKFSYITSESYNTSISKAGEVDAFKDQDYKYEIFTKLSGGAKFYFRSENGIDFYSLNEAGTEVVRISSPSEASGTVAEDGVYRIRFNVSSGKAYVASVDEVSHFFCWTQKLTPMKYVAKGVWVIENLNIALQSTSWGFDERYKFKFMIDGQAQPYGRLSTNGERPRDNWGADYWYLQPALPDQWDPAFKYLDSLCDVNNLTRWYADLYLYMNDDKGHYTHEFKNAHE